MLWIGLTGGIASGKSEATKLLKSMAFPVIDADLIAHQVVERGTPGLKSVVDHFGAEILNPDGSLNRKKLGQIVFTSTDQRLALENLLHPLVQQEVQRQKHQYAQNGKSIAFYDVPLLFEKNLQGQFDKVVLIFSSLDLQKSRLRQRDQLSDLEIENRLQSQIPLIEKEKKSDFVIYNDHDLAHLEKQLKDLVAQLQKS